MRSKRRLLRTAAAVLMAVIFVIAPCAAAMGSDTGTVKTEAKSAPQEEAETGETEAESAPKEEAGIGETEPEFAPQEEAGTGETEPEFAPQEEAGTGETEPEFSPQEGKGAEQTEGGSAPEEEANAALQEPAVSKEETGEKPAASKEEVEQKAAQSAEKAADEEDRLKTKAVKKLQLEAVSEPDWLSGGTGDKKDLSDQLDALFGEEYKIRYREYALGGWATVTFNVDLGEAADDQEALCLDPLMISSGVAGTHADHVYEYSTPMLVKAMYYGIGPGNSVLKEIITEVTGSDKNLDEICNVITHVSLSQVYAKLHEADPNMGTLKSKYGDGFFATSDLLKELANRYGNKIAGLPVPDDYYVYVTALDNPDKQDFGFGAFRIRFPKADIRLKKSPGERSIVQENACYSLAGAQYDVFADEECSQKAGTLVTGEDGTSEPLEVDVGKTYYIKESAAPEGYCLDPKIYEVTPVEDQEVCTLEVEEQPAVAGISIEIWKKSRKQGSASGKSPEGTEFTIQYFDGYYEPDDLPSEPERTWVIKALKTEEGCLARMKEENRVSGEFYKEGDEAVLPLGTVAITETKAADGFVNDGEFGEGVRTFVGQIRINEEKSGAELTAVRGTPSLHTDGVLRFEVEDTPVEKKPEIGTSAVNRETGTHIGAPHGTVTIDDTVTYKDLEPGAAYIMKGRLIDRASREAVRDGDGREVTAEMPFTADASGAGSVVMTFSFESGESLAGKTLVAYEAAVDAGTGKKAAAHENPDDEGQSIHFPEGRTTALDSETEDHIANADQKVTIRDTITYKNLIPGFVYRAEGVLMDADTGKPMLSGGEKIVSVKEFTPRRESGSVTVEFEFDGTELSGRRTVVFEKVKYRDICVLIHEDLKDEGQTIRFPEGKTTALDSETEDHIANADQKVTIRDTITYKNLIPGLVYRAEGVLMDADTGKPVLSGGQKIVSVREFTPDKESGSVTVEFEFDGTELSGRRTVVFEKVKYRDKLLFAHEDLKDEGQTIRFPEGKTTALDSETEGHIANADQKVTIRDTITYKNLIPGLVYRAEGVLMDADTGKPVLSGGQKIVSVREFTPDKESGSVTVEFEFDGTELSGRRTVVFEKVKYRDICVLIHEDLKDEGQTIVFPSVATSAEDQRDGDKTVRSEKNARIRDIVRYTNLIPGREYVLKGILMDKKTGLPLRINRDIVTGESTFVPRRPDSTAKLEIRFNASGVRTGDVVFFEDLYEVNPDTGVRRKVGSHRDINDSEQTLHFTEPEKPGRSADTGDGNDPGTIMAVLFLCAVLMSAAVLCIKGKAE